MRVKTKLQLNAALSIFAAVALLLMLVLSLHRLNNAVRGAVIAGDIISTSFENSAFRTDYLQGGSERARQQWFATRNEIGRLLATAASLDWDPEEAELLREIETDHQAAGKLFSQLVAGRREIPERMRPAALTEREKRLSTQLVIGSYETVLHARKLQELSLEHLYRAMKQAGWGLLGVMAVVLGSSIVSSWSLAKLLTQRFTLLREGTVALAKGNLTHVIALKGGDEFAELSTAFDEMTQRLRQSYLDLEKEIAERRQAEEAARASEERLRGIFDNAGVGIVEVAGTDRFIAVNDRICEMLGYERDQLLALSVEALTAPEDRPLSNEMNRRIHEGESARAMYDKRYLKRDGSRLWVHVNISAVRDGGGEWSRSIATIEDITERKLAEEAVKEAERQLRRAKDELEQRVRERTEALTRALEELRVESAERIQAVEELRQKEQMMMQQARLAAMGEMLGNISHQWRQPLNVLNIIIQDLGRSYDRGKFTREYLGETIARGKQLIAHMSQTIDDFRTFLHPDKARGTFDLREAVEKAVVMVADSMKEIEVRVAAEGPVPADGYFKEYIQAVINILMNARDVLRERDVPKPVIELRVFSEGGKSVLTVADNAGGVPDEIIDKIFDPYFTTKGPDKGTGIGLYMAKTIIDRSMGGSLTVRNTPHGAEFRIEI